MKRILFALGILAVVLAGFYYYYLRVPAFPVPELKGELRSAQVTAAGLPREFDYFVPDEIPAGAPLVFSLHGSLGNSEQARLMFGYRFDQLAEEHGFIAVYPNGFDRHWNDCRAAADYRANTEDVDDIAFFRAMIDYMVETYRSDPARVLVTGLSNGGHMAYKLALEAPELVTAVAPIAAGLPVWEENDCQATRQSVPVAIINGTEDPVNPYEGGVVSILGNDSRGTVLSSMGTAAYFAQLAGHLRPTATVELADFNTEDESIIELTAWQSPGLDEILHYAVIGGGHVVPSKVIRSPRILGGTNADIEAADEIWDFFERVMERQ